MVLLPWETTGQTSPWQRTCSLPCKSAEVLWDSGMASSPMGQSHVPRGREPQTQGSMSPVLGALLTALVTHHVRGRGFACCS